MREIKERKRKEEVIEMDGYSPGQRRPEEMEEALSPSSHQILSSSSLLSPSLPRLIKPTKGI